MPKNRHKMPRKVAIPVALAGAAALGWTSIGLPGWADEAARQPSAGSGASQAAAPPVACDQKDSSGKGWYQPVYVHAEGHDNSAKAIPKIQQILWDSDQVFEASAQRFGHGDSRRLRFVQDGQCRIEVMSVSVGDLGGRPAFSTTRKKAQMAVAAQIAKSEQTTRNRFKRTRLVYFFDNGARGCGVGAGPGAKARANLHRGYAAVSWKCGTVAAVTHELIHNFGVSHCDNNHSQGGDPICRGYDKTPRCNDVMANVVLDCAKDEFHYFDPRPAKGSYLATHPGENVANSPYLIKDRPAESAEVRLVAQNTGKCLDSARSSVRQESCEAGDAQAWRRSIGADGYLTFTFDGKCLTAASGNAAPALSACEKGDLRQEWWTPSGRSYSADRYRLVNRANKGNLRVPGRTDIKRGGQTASEFRMEPVESSGR
ncbi:RICIN domain-containing protein [Streptomyces sp. NPDC127074]|uniref:RICIN domain-containing protein n=1 Tax=Streptomyces sp. NPDC127074 TaxID=3347130 RepID=UPI00365AD95D